MAAAARLLRPEWGGEVRGAGEGERGLDFFLLPFLIGVGMVSLDEQEEEEDEEGGEAGDGERRVGRDREADRLLGILEDMRELRGAAETGAGGRLQQRREESTWRVRVGSRCDEGCGRWRLPYALR